MLELVRQRVFGLAAGYADCNDAARLADDVIHKLVVGRDPIAGPALASQPTLSRFENAVGRRELIAMGHVLADTVIEHHRRRLKGRATRITIDLDPTDDPTHGQQEFSFFNGHYDTWCYLPMVAAVTFDEDAEQCAAGQARPALDGQGAPALSNHGPHRPSLWRDAVRSADVEAEAPRDYQGRSRTPSGARAEEQPAVCRDQPARRPRGGLSALLPARRRGEPAQRAASRLGAGSDQLLPVSGQPAPRPADAGRVHPVPGTAPARGRHRLCRRPGHDAARALAQTRGVGRALGAPDRAALATELPLASDVVAGRSRRGRDLVARLLPGRAGTRALVSRRGPTAAALKRADTPRRTLLSELPTRSAARWPEPGLLGAARAVERAVPVTHE